VLWGVAFANIVRGVPIDASKEYVGTTLTLLNPYALLGGLTTLGLFLTHGALFLALKTDGDIRHRARDLALVIGLATSGVAVVFLVWTQLITGDVWSSAFFTAAAFALVGGLLAAWNVREGWAFVGTFAAIGLAVAGLFVALFPDVMPSSIDAAYSLTTTNASATDYTLTIMTWVAVLFTPIVLMYQGWTYWVFRKRIAVHHIPTPVAAQQES
jgi:cytochrome bd ubiquinol oxidase subunit II